LWGWSRVTPAVGATLGGHRSGISGTDPTANARHAEVCPIQFQPRSWTARAFPTRSGNSGRSCRGTTAAARSRHEQPAGLASAEQLGFTDYGPASPVFCKCESVQICNHRCVCKLEHIQICATQTLAKVNSCKLALDNHLHIKHMQMCTR